MVKQQGSSRPKTGAELAKYAEEYNDRLRQARKNGEMTAWCDGISIVFPLLVAMDIPYLFADAYAARASAKHVEKRLQEIASDVGYLSEVCSYTRTHMGMAHMSDEEKDRSDPYYQMPNPNFAIVTDAGCSMLVPWGKATADYFDIPMFVIQVPHRWTNKVDEQAAIAETTTQLRQLVTWIEEQSGRKLDWDRLREIMVGVKQAVEYRHECLQMSRLRPVPATFFDFAASLGGINYLIGRPECVTFHRDLRDELAERVKNGIGSVANEKYRLYWDGIMCWPKFGHLARKFADHNAAVVVGRYTHWGFYHDPDVLDPDKPLESMAASLVTMHGARGMDNLIDQISEFCVDYSIDGLVMVAQHTCRPFSAGGLEIMDGVSRKLGIPGISFESDIADETFYSDAQVDTRLQALLETIDANRRRR